MLNPQLLHVEHPLLERVEVHNMGTISNTLRQDVTQLILGSGIPDLLGSTDPLGELNEYNHNLHILGFGPDGVVGHIAATFHEGGFGTYNPEQASRLIQIRSVVSSIHKKGIFSAMFDAFVTSMIVQDSKLLDLLTDKEGSPNALGEERAKAALQNPILLMASEIFPFIRSYSRILVKNRFSHNTGAVVQATGHSNQLILENDEPVPHLRVITGVGSIMPLDGIRIPVRNESTAAYEVDFNTAAAILRTLSGYDGDIVADNEHVVALLRHSSQVHSQIIHILSQEVLVGKTSLVDPNAITTRAVFEKI